MSFTHDPLNCVNYIWGQPVEVVDGFSSYINPKGSLTSAVYVPLDEWHIAYSICWETGVSRAYFYQYNNLKEIVT